MASFAESSGAPAAQASTSLVSGRELAITNSFEIAFMERGNVGDVDMDTERSEKGGVFDVDREFLETRREQYRTNAKSTRSKFIELKYSVETGEAERIAVDGAAKAGGDDGVGGSALVISLTTQRNAVAMLHERMRVLLAYIAGVINGEQ
ncbi:hypothetical protein QFC19_001883 [Naganishia cerealis]|uniref:Uncharacterized protein n=1 Tax=Naganishia cerealis TaxID=610337 RepID=A0ACC2WEL8_9TREE|nr:hypothetical protein QFC19_001883 [Naganishia cerealis]